MGLIRIALGLIIRDPRQFPGYGNTIHTYVYGLMCFFVSFLGVGVANDLG